MMWRPLAACTAVFLCGRAYAQRAEADAEFQRGRTLIAEGKTAEACAAFEASMKLDPEKGTLYNLGLCHEKLGKLASGWSELDELSRTDTNRARSDDAGKHAAALLPRLTRMHLVLDGKADGVTITRDKVDVTPLVGKEAPVDPGQYTFVATGRDGSTTSVEADLTAEGKTIDVTLDAPKPGSGGGRPVIDPEVFPIALPRRPILIPHGMAEVTADGTAATSNAFDRVGIFAGAGVRARLGPLEVSGVLTFIPRSPVILNKPSPWDTIELAVKYPFDPGFVAGASFTERQPLRDNARASELAGFVERKLLLYPNVAVDGTGAVVFTQRDNGNGEFALAGEGRVQVWVAGGLSLQGSATLGLNLVGSLADHTVDLSVAALVLYAVKPNFDVFVVVGTELLPEADLHTYTAGASWRTR